MKKRLWLPLLWSALILAAWRCRAALTAEAVAAWTPGQSYLAVLILLALYGLKGLTGALPVTALEAAAGLLLPFPAALGTNLCGGMAAQAGPYFLGRRQKERLAGLAARFPGLEISGPASLRRVCLLRLGGVLPMELVSLWLGAAGTAWGPYFAGGLLGSFPRVLGATALGAALWGLGGKRFWLSCVFGWALTGAAALIWGREWARQPRSFRSRRMSSPKKGRI